MLKKLPVILVFIDWYKPAYKGGGIISCCDALVEHLKDRYCFKIITRNADLGSTKQLEGIKSDCWVQRTENVEVFYLSKDKIGVFNMKSLIESTPHDLLYINGVFSFYFSLLPLIINKWRKLQHLTLVAPMGMLCLGALKFKNIKKTLYLKTAKLLNLYSDISWHLSSEYEKNDLEKVLGSEGEFYVAPYLFNPPQTEYKTAKKENNLLRMVFISRISPKKNLLACFRYLSQVDLNVKVIFDVYGPVEDESYWNECLNQMNKLGKNIQCSYRGELKAEEVIKTFQSYNVSILPTFSENFGQVIPESLLAACPVIISDQTPWNKLEEHSAGWVFSLKEENRFVDIICTLAKMTNEQFRVYSEGAYQYAKGFLDSEQLVLESVRMFDAKLNQ